MMQVVFLRHGESVWNKENLFTGWTDVDLSDRGKVEAREAGTILRQEGFSFDIAFTSVLKRAIRTLWMVLDEMDLMWIPVNRDWRLNERHYGALQGLNKAETTASYGETQVKAWRRSYDIRPPELSADDPRHPRRDPRYRDIAPQILPSTECLKDTVARVLPCWNDVISPLIRGGKRVLVTAHGNSLRALVKYLDGISDSDIAGLDIPTGVSLVYELDDGLKPLGHHYLGDQDKIAQAIKSVAAQATKPSSLPREPRLGD